MNNEILVARHRATKVRIDPNFGCAILCDKNFTVRTPLTTVSATVNSLEESLIFFA
jgi:hypothetical protein